MPASTNPTFYCVMTYLGEVTYRGRKIDRACLLMNPGTVCGFGPTDDQAFKHAMELRGRACNSENVKLRKLVPKHGRRNV